MTYALVHAVSIGQVVPLFGANTERDVRSAIVKSPVSEPANPQRIAVGLLGVAGDAQADHQVHGGPRKAVYCYPLEHYTVWRTLRLQALKLDEPLPCGFLGENLTVSGLLEPDVYIGDTLVIGDGGLRLRVASPRSPCFKFSVRMGFKQASRMMVQSGYTGFYTEVLTEGSVAYGDAITVLPGPRVISVAERHRMLTKGGQKDLI